MTDHTNLIAQPPAPAQAASGAPSESLSDVQRQAFIKGWDHRGMAHELKGSVETDDRMRVLMGVFYPMVDAALSDTAITYMTGYSDGREWAAAPIPQQPSVPEGWKQAVALAYGHLWHVNNEPMAPIPLRSSETAAYEARKQLRDLLTHEERGLAINRVQAMLSAAPQPKETK